MHCLLVAKEGQYFELVGDVGVPSFLRRCRRFTARRRTPVLRISDNAKIFKTTGKNLKQLIIIQK